MFRRYANTTGIFTSTCHPYDQGDHRSHHPWPQPKGTAVCPTTCDDGEGPSAPRFPTANSTQQKALSRWSVPAVLASTKHHGTAPYAVPHNVSAIKLELMTNGPSGTQMTVCKRPCSPALIGSAALQLNETIARQTMISVRTKAACTGRRAASRRRSARSARPGGTR